MVPDMNLQVCPLALRFCCFIGVVSVLTMNSCVHSTAIVDSKADASWQSNMTSAQIAVVRSAFPDFQPELFKPGTDPNDRSKLGVSNFQPARFFGPGNQQSQLTTTPAGIIVETLGFDVMMVPPALPLNPPYYDPSGALYNLDLRLQRVSALHKIEERLGMPPSSSGPWIEYDPTGWQVSTVEIDRILSEVRNSIAIQLPQVQNVPLSRCQVRIEPTIFWVQNSNFGNTWAGGLTRSLPGGHYRLHLALFYVNGQRVQNDWRRLLIDEGINCLVLSIGRPDLAR